MPHGQQIISLKTVRLFDHDTLGLPWVLGMTEKLTRVIDIEISPELDMPTEDGEVNPRKEP